MEDASEEAEEGLALEDTRRRNKQDWESDRTNQQAELAAERAKLHDAREALEEEKRRMTSLSASRSDIISLNLGGERVVQRRRSTLCAVESSFFASCFSGRWETVVDLDKDGNHFVNYPPELIVPVLDYLGMRETEGPDVLVPLPQGPAHAKPQFEAMLRYLGLSPATRTLEAVSTPYDSVSLSCYGLAFELRPRGSRYVSVVALETCSQTDLSSATVFACEGSLDQCLLHRGSWSEVGRGTLAEGKPSRIQLAQPLTIRTGVTHCLYIATDKTFGVAYVGPESGGVSAENEDMQLFAARFSGSGTHFDGFYTRTWYHFNGRIEYTAVP